LVGFGFRVAIGKSRGGEGENERTYGGYTAGVNTKVLGESHWENYREVCTYYSGVRRVGGGKGTGRVIVQAR
jgi:hypothetical protein